MLYDRGGGVDAPLGVVRMEYSDELRCAQVIAPHATWRGSYDRGTPITGQCLVYSSNGKQLAPPPDSTPATGDQYGGVVGGGTYNGTKEHCIEVDWPATYTWSARQYRRGYSGPSSWMGSLIFESRDASGLYYRGNRYYDSEKGRFTQEDPIGLAGGVNTYGFALGDPLSYRDPYGLCNTLADGTPDPECIARLQKLKNLTESVTRRANQWNAAVRDGMLYGRDHSSQTHLGNLTQERSSLTQLLDRVNRFCGDDDDDNPSGLRAAAREALAIPIMAGPARYPDKGSIPPHMDRATAENIERAGWTGVAGAALMWLARAAVVALAL